MRIITGGKKTSQFYREVEEMAFPPPLIYMISLYSQKQKDLESLAQGLSLSEDFSKDRTPNFEETVIT